jgi:3-hydroxyisobutyrate dehydrogenase-like beta-hydroxyacid dehydrogenase
MSQAVTSDRALRVGVVGLGRMGSAIAAKLGSQGWRVSGWTRSGKPSGAAVVPEIAVAPDLPTLVARADIIILSLFDDAAVIAVVKQLVLNDLRGKLIVDTSTVGPDTLRSLANDIAGAGGGAIDAPIAGGPEMVMSGTASVLVGGDRQVVERFMSIARSFSDRVLHVGELGSGAAAKIVNNMMIIGYWQCLKEALLIGKRAGLSAAAMLDVLSRSPAANGALGRRIPIILGESDEVGFTVRGVVKDATLFEDLAAEYGVPIPALAAALASYRAHSDRGYGEADSGTMMRTAYVEI